LVFSPLSLLSRWHPVEAPQRRAAFPISLYVTLSGADLVFSLIAFSLGIAEGNPFMAWLLKHGLFLPGKIGVTLLVAGLMLVVYVRARRGRSVVWAGVWVMASVVALHLWALPRLLHMPARFA
jgi:hypothetical protein